jgi:opacity protein-like surface antigen
MKKLLVIALASLATSAVMAQEKPYYFELGVGKSATDVETNTYSGSASGITYSNAKIDLDYKKATTYGFEIGQSNFLGTPLRVGFGMTTMKIKLDSATGSGTVSNGSTTVNFAGTATAAQIRSVGITFDNDVKVYGVNAYYDFDMKSAFKPFVGVGVGMADIQYAKDKELAYGLHIGVNYDIDKDFYVGAKASRHIINGPTDTLGLTYKDINVTYLGVQLGVRF